MPDQEVGDVLEPGEEKEEWSDYHLTIGRLTFSIAFPARLWKAVLSGQSISFKSLAALSLSRPSGLPCRTGRPLDVFTERSIDVRLVFATSTSMGLEPGYDVRVKPQRNLLLRRPVEDPAPGVGPVERRLRQ